MVSKRNKLLATITLMLLAAWFSIAYYQYVNFATLSEDTYVSYSILSVIVLAFLVILSIIDICILVSSLWSRHTKRPSEPRFGT